MIIMPWFSKSSIFKMFTVHTKTENRRFQVPRGFEERFRKTKSFGDGLVWTVDLTVEE